MGKRNHNQLRKSKIYREAFQSASSYIRKQDFIHYFPIIAQPTDIGNECMAFLWAAIHCYDDLTDEIDLTLDQKDELHVNIYETAHEMYNNSFDIEKADGDLMKWLYFYIGNDLEYGFDTYRYLRLLYESNVEDHERRGKIYTNKQLNKLIYKKAACGIKAMYGFGLRIDDVVGENLARALQIEDDLFDLEFDLSVGQINITKEDIDKFEIELDSPDLLSQLQAKGFYDYRATQVLQHIKIARKEAMKIEDSWTRKFSLTVSELIAAPILENRFVPGGKYYVKGGKILNFLLSKDEKKAYRIGHRLIKIFSRIVPQCNHFSLNKRLNRLPETEPCI